MRTFIWLLNLAFNFSSSEDTVERFKIATRLLPSKMGTPYYPHDCSRWFHTPERTIAESLSHAVPHPNRASWLFSKNSMHRSSHIVHTSVHSHHLAWHFRYLLLVDPCHCFVLYHTTGNPLYQCRGQVCLWLCQQRRDKRLQSLLNLTWIHPIHRPMALCYGPVSEQPRDYLSTDS